MMIAPFTLKAPQNFCPLYLDFTDTTKTIDTRITFARASSATYIGNDGLLKTAGSGVARAHAFAHHDIATLSCLGFLLEEQATNNALWCRDFTNAAWAKTNMTAALTATGVDGAANSASTLTATAGNATALQTVTSTSRARFLTAFVRRRTGTGTIQMTLDGGTAWTTITITSSWRRYKIPTQTIANPNFGFRIVTSGDEIDVDYVQQEDRNFETSPILTTASSATRLRDSAVISGSNFSGFWNATEGTLVAWFRRDAADNSQQGQIVNVSDGTNSNTISLRHVFSTTPFAGMNNGGVTQTDWGFSTNPSIGTTVKAANAYKLNDSNASFNGTAQTVDTSCTIPTVDRLVIGDRSAGDRTLNGCVLRLAYYRTRLSDAAIAGLTA